MIYSVANKASFCVQRFVTAVTILACIACAVPSVSMGGVQGPGGGVTLRPDRSPTYREFQAQVSRARLVFPYVLQRFELAEYIYVGDQLVTSSFQERYPALHEKLFAGHGQTKTMYDIFKLIHTYEVRETGACPDPDGKPKDASARLVNGKPIICFSYHRMVHAGIRIKNRNSMQRITAVLAHELSHLLEPKTTEPEAQNVENMVLDQVHEKTFASFEIEQETHRAKLAAVEEEIDAAIRVVESAGSAEAIKAALLPFQTEVERGLDWLLTSSPGGLYFSDWKNHFRLQLLELQMMSAMRYVETTDESIPRILNGRVSAPVREFIDPRGCGVYCSRIDSAPLLYAIPVGNAAQLLMQLREMKSLIQAITK